METKEITKQIQTYMGYLQTSMDAFDKAVYTNDTDSINTFGKDVRRLQAYLVELRNERQKIEAGV